MPVNIHLASGVFLCNKIPRGKNSSSQCIIIWIVCRRRFTPLQTCLDQYNTDPAHEVPWQATVLHIYRS